MVKIVPEQCHERDLDLSQPKEQPQATSGPPTKGDPLIGVHLSHIFLGESVRVKGGGILPREKGSEEGPCEW